jgi:hypothetical protein
MKPVMQNPRRAARWQRHRVHIFGILDSELAGHTAHKIRARPRHEDRQIPWTFDLQRHAAIMASGPVCRTKRPNTWLHRPNLRREDSPCQPGAVHTWHERASSVRLRMVCLPRCCGDCARGARTAAHDSNPRPAGGSDQKSWQRSSLLRSMLFLLCPCFATGPTHGTESCPFARQGLCDALLAYAGVPAPVSYLSIQGARTCRHDGIS